MKKVCSVLVLLLLWGDYAVGQEEIEDRGGNDPVGLHPALGLVPEEEAPIPEEEAPTGMRVVGASPADGEAVAVGPTVVVIDFSDPYLPLSVDPTDLVVNSTSADSVVLTDADTVTFEFLASPMVDEGPQSVAIAAGAVERDGAGEGSALLAAYNATVYLDSVELQVVATRPAQGVVGLPLTTLEVDFNEEIDAASVDATDLVLSQGKAVSATVIDADTVEFTLEGVNQEGQLFSSLRRGAVKDKSNNPGRGFTASHHRDIQATPYPVPLEAKAPKGSLIYDPSVSGLLAVSLISEGFESGSLGPEWTTSSSHSDGRIRVTSSLSGIDFAPALPPGSSPRGHGGRGLPRGAARMVALRLPRLEKVSDRE